MEQPNEVVPQELPVKEVPDYGIQSQPLHPVPKGTSAVEQYRAREERRESNSAWEDTKAMWRQDSFVDGLLASYVGNQMVPDPDYNVYEESEWNQLIEGIAPEYWEYFADSTSAAHALYIKGLLLQKQEDQQQLSDLDTLGNVGRFAFNLVEPASTLSMLIGGGVAKGAGVARAVSNMGRSGRFLAGIGTGAAFNAGFEKVRQEYNFEDSKAQIIEAAVLGAAFTAPFAAAGVLRPSELRKIADTTAKDLSRMYGSPDRISVGKDGKYVLSAEDLNAVTREQSSLDSWRVPPEHSQKGLEGSLEVPEDFPP